MLQSISPYQQRLLITSCLPWSSNAWVSSWPITTPMPPKFRALEKQIVKIFSFISQYLILYTGTSRRWWGRWRCVSLLLWPGMTVEGGLKYASRKYHLILGGVVISIHCRWGHTPSVQEEEASFQRNSSKQRIIREWVSRGCSECVRAAPYWSLFGAFLSWSAVTRPEKL